MTNERGFTRCFCLSAPESNDFRPENEHCSQAGGLAPQPDLLGRHAAASAVLLSSLQSGDLAESPQLLLFVRRRPADAILQIA
jgi:hypothetical protein